MSMQEKKSILNVGLSLVTSVLYWAIIYSRYNQGLFDVENEMRFWAIVILIFIPISIVVRIIGMILFAIFESIRSEVKGEEMEEIDLTDERDQLIDLRTTNVSLILFSLGFIIALFTQVFGGTVHIFFIVLLVSGLLAEIGSEGLKLYYYNKGIS